MPRPLTECDIKLTPDILAMAGRQGVEIEMLYWNGSIPRECVLIAKGSDKAYLGPAVIDAILAAEKDIYGGL